jgi:RsmE family RNA methyltransferase
MNLILFLLEELLKAQQEQGGKNQTQKAAQKQGQTEGDVRLNDADLVVNKRSQHLLGSVAVPLVRQRLAEVESKRNGLGDGGMGGEVFVGQRVMSRVSGGVKERFKGLTGRVVAIFTEFSQKWCSVRFPGFDKDFRFNVAELAAVGDLTPTAEAKATGTAPSAAASASSSTTPPLSWDPMRFSGVRLRLALSDPRAAHVEAILKASQGSTLRVGVVGGGTGYAKATWQPTAAASPALTTTQTQSAGPSEVAKGDAVSPPQGATAAAEPASGVASGVRGSGGRSGSDAKAADAHDTKKRQSAEEVNQKRLAKRRRKEQAKLNRQRAEQANAQRVLLIEFGRLDRDAPLPEVHVLLAHPRPRVLGRLWSVLAQLGVAQVVVVNAHKVDKQYWHSQRSCLKEKLRLPLMLEGLQQGGHTRLPKVRIERFFQPFLQKLDQIFPKGGGNGGVSVSRLLCDLGDYPTMRELVPRTVDAKNTRQGICLAIGPEGGWTQFEVEALKERGFVGVTIGRVIMRCDVAATCGVAMAADHLAWLERQTGAKSAAIDKRKT